MLDRLARLLDPRGRPDSTVRVFIDFPSEDRAARAVRMLQRNVTYSVAATGSGTWRLSLDYQAWSKTREPHADHFKETADYMRGR